MSGLSKPAKFYICIMLLVGAAVLAWQLPRLARADAGLLLALSLLASVAQVLKVEGATARSSYNISWVVISFALVLLGAPAALLVALVAHVVEWIWHKYPWFIQSFNIATYAVTIQAASLVARWANPGPMLLNWTGAAGLLGAIIVFTVVNHLLVGLVIKLARGESLAKSGVFDVLTLLIDASLLCLGAAAAFVWLVNPYAALLAVVPLYLVYSTLKVPALKRQTLTDPKTGLYNSSHLTNVLAQELERADRFDRPLTVVMADLDLLRNINNTYGHLAGDVVLVGVARLLQKAVRDYDLVARFGGEEFCILMPETAAQDALPRMEAIRTVIEAAEFDVTTSIQPIRVTMSFGIAGRRGFGQSTNDVLHAADLAVYRAKLEGRNRVCLGLDGPLVETPRPAASADSLPEAPSQTTQTQRLDNQPPEKPSGPLQPLKSVLKPLPPWITTVYIALVAVAALSLAGLLIPLAAQPDWAGLAIFATFVFLAEWLAIDIYARDSSVSTSAAPYIGGVLLFGPIGALFLSLILAGVAFIKHRSRPRSFVFNLANHWLAGLWCLVLVAWLPARFAGQSAPAQALIGLLSGGLVYLSSTLLIAGVIHFDTGEPFRQAWQERFRWLWPYYFAIGLTAFALDFSYRTAGVLGLLVMVVPLLMLRLGQMQYIEHTKNLVRQLRGTNGELLRRAGEISSLNDELLMALSHAIDLRDPFVLGHSRQVARYATLIAQELELPSERVEVVRKAALLHDFGKLAVPESILFKPDRLTPTEYEAVKQHVTVGADIIQDCSSLRALVPLVRHHHETYDGHGYPDQLGGQSIPLESRILTLADAVEAMASDRPYRKAMAAKAILDEVQMRAGSQFDPLVAAAFVHVVRRLGEAVIVNSAHYLAPQAPRGAPPDTQIMGVAPSPALPVQAITELASAQR